MTDAPRKDKGKAMKPPADATHCGGYPIDTPTPDLTAPEQVKWHLDISGNHEAGLIPTATRQLVEALSAKLAEAEAELAHHRDLDRIAQEEAREVEGCLRAELREAEAELAAYREMHAEINAQGGPNVVRLQMQARRDRIRAEAAEAERGRWERAHWEACVRSGKSLAERDAALEALEPFSIMAGVLFAMNYELSDDVFSIKAEHGEVAMTFEAFKNAHAAARQKGDE